MSNSIEKGMFRDLMNVDMCLYYLFAFLFLNKNSPQESIICYFGSCFMLNHKELMKIRCVAHTLVIDKVRKNRTKTSTIFNRIEENEKSYESIFSALCH